MDLAERAATRHPRAVKRQRSLRRRRIVALCLLALAILCVSLFISLAQALTNPALGSSVSARLAEWGREHGAGSLVTWAENEWYGHHAPPVGGRPPVGAIKQPPVTVPPMTVPPMTVHPVTLHPVASGPAHLPPPAPIVPFATPVIAGEGQWSPAGRPVGGVPALYTTTLRPDAIHTSYVVGVAWMDTKLLRTTLYSGSQIPGGGPFTHTAPVTPAASCSLEAAFNAGFLLPDANGGYYTDGRTIAPLVPGAASFVVYRNGTATIGQWGRDASLTPDVVSVRQNLDLLVDAGQPVAGLDATDTTRWGATLGNQIYVWRSGVGVTADGALVYVGGPGLNITDLANLLVRAGAVRAMELDINADWVNFATYTPAAHQCATGSNGTTLVPGMSGAASRYFESYWARDFFTLSAVTAP